MTCHVREKLPCQRDNRPAMSEIADLPCQREAAPEQCPPCLSGQNQGSKLLPTRGMPGTAGSQWPSTEVKTKALEEEEKLINLGPHSGFYTWPIAAFSEPTDSSRRREGRITSCALEIHCPEPPTKAVMI